jgi:methionyl-tRNA formyltransferase
MNSKIYKTIFFGTPEFAVPILKMLATLPYLKIKAVVTQPDKPVGKKQIITPPPVKIASEKNKAVVLQPEKIKTEEFEKKLRELNPDVAIVAAYGKIIPKNLLNIPKHGWLNVHASLLPKYRGASPIQGAILNNEETTGVSLMKIDAGLDSGPILYQKRLTLEPNDNFQTLHDKLSRLGAELVKNKLLDYLEGKINAQSQDSSQATETKIIKKEDGRIDWSKPAEYIERQIRAFMPWPGTYCSWNGKNVKIKHAIVTQLPTNIKSGTVWKHGNTIIVGTGQHGLQLKTVQLEGKKALPIEEFIKGHPEFGQTKLS